MNLFKKDKYKGSSQHLKMDLNVYKTMNRRLVILMLSIALIAGALIGRLYYVQIINHDHYEQLVASKQAAPRKTGTARGEIYDRNGELIVTNKPINTINYFEDQYISMDTQWELAEKFAERYEVDFELMPRELKDLYLFLNDNGDALVTYEETRELDFDTAKVDALKLSRITDEHLETLTDFEKETFKIYLKMNSQTESDSAIILEDATDEDISYLSEHQSDFPGFSWGTTWERTYVGPAGLENIIGKVQEIPEEKLEYMLAKGYANNDRVGVSGIEYMYEEYLSGVKTSETVDPTTGETIELTKGERGHDLILTLDLKLQKQIENEIKQEWAKMKKENRREYMNGLDFVTSDPQTGEILSIIGLRESSSGKVYNDPTMAFLDGFPVGSVVKGATVYAGLEEGVVKQGEVIVDRPLNIAGTIPRVSWRNLGPVTDITALQHSSNIYMYMVAIRLAEGTYIPNAPLNFNKPIEDSFALLRNYFSQFGLGVETMVDFPREELGYKGSTQHIGLLLDFAVGQYDNYNAIQLNQYISTVANDGYRLKPHLVKEARNSIDNNVILKNVPEIINELDGKDSLKRVQEGFRMCNASGSCGAFPNKPYTSAGKTGTAEYNDHGGKTMINTSLIFYAPFENPEVATSCIHSGAYYGEGGYHENVCKILTPKIADIYMNSK
ncbi:MAG TPA: penicillin-binding protein 2 [Erysipelothrix sp.]|nr:penicillin-binding protein 2 [Erysipelothrix sp.]